MVEEIRKKALEQVHIESIILDHLHKLRALQLHGVYDHDTLIQLHDEHDEIVGLFNRSYDNLNPVLAQDLSHNMFLYANTFAQKLTAKLDKIAHKPYSLDNKKILDDLIDAGNYWSKAKDYWSNHRFKSKKRGKNLLKLLDNIKSNGQISSEHSALITEALDAHVDCYASRVEIAHSFLHLYKEKGANGELKAFLRSVSDPYLVSLMAENAGKALASGTIKALAKLYGKKLPESSVLALDEILTNPLQEEYSSTGTLAVFGKCPETKQYKIIGGFSFDLDEKSKSSDEAKKLKGEPATITKNQEKTLLKRLSTCLYMI